MSLLFVAVVGNRLVIGSADWTMGGTSVIFLFEILQYYYRGSLLPSNCVVLAVKEDWPGGAGNGEN
jgi:hypothetical protein